MFTPVHKHHANTLHTAFKRTHRLRERFAEKHAMFLSLNMCTVGDKASSYRQKCLETIVEYKAVLGKTHFSKMMMKLS